MLTALLISAAMYAQKKIGAVSGTVIAAENKPVNAATVQLMHAADNSLVKVAVTDKTDYFSYEKLTEGKYLVSITAVGFAKKITAPLELTAAHQTIDLATVPLSEQVKGLSEVTVVSIKPFIEQRPDRTIVNVEDSPSNAGATALEVLEKSSGVSVDNDGNISLKGKRGVIVMMDEKPTYLSGADLANILRNLPASALDQIEIMTNPSSKNDASGNSGLINIKIKKK